MVNLNSLFEKIDSNSRQFLITQLNDYIRKSLNSETVLSELYTNEQLIIFYYNRLDRMSHIQKFSDGLKLLHDELNKIEVND